MKLDVRIGVGAAAVMVVILAVAGAATSADEAPLTGSALLARAEAAAHAPVVRVVDTVSSLGPLAAEPQTVTLADLVRFHGHPCDGLLVAAAGIAHGLDALFPDGVVDRTDLAVAVNRSACYGDVAAYLTGARHRYGSLVVDPKLGDEWIVHRRSTGATVAVRLRPGVKPKELPALEAKLRAAQGCPRDLTAEVQRLQAGFALEVLARPPAEVFTVTRLERFPYDAGAPRPDTAKASCPAVTAGSAAEDVTPAP